MGKTILIFVDGDLFKQIEYKTKRDANGNYRLFKKHGVIDYETGLRVSGKVEIELL